MAAVPVYVLYGLFKILPLDVASWLGGFLGKSIGKRLLVNKRALYNMQHILPGKTEKFYKATLESMWENLGRNMGELPHLKKIIKDENRLKLKNFFHVQGLEKDKAGFFLGAHYGNWEISAPSIARNTGLHLNLVYRKINNPYVERLIFKCRDQTEGLINYYPKGSLGAKACIKALKNKEIVGMLLDQKFNDGILVPFMGKPAMTAPALAQLALKFKAPVIPVRCMREKGAYFTLEFFPPVGPYKKDEDITVKELTEQFNTIIGSWIYECPEMWFWVHSRWPFSKKMK